MSRCWSAEGQQADEVSMDIFRGSWADPAHGVAPPARPLESSSRRIAIVDPSHSLPNQDGEWGSPAVSSGNRLASLHQVMSLVKADFKGAPGRIRTCAHGLGTLPAALTVAARTHNFPTGPCPRQQVRKTLVREREVASLTPYARGDHPLRCHSASSEPVASWPGSCLTSRLTNTPIRDRIRCTTWTSRHENALLSATSGHTPSPAGRASNDS